jgi:hypothetical protein
MWLMPLQLLLDDDANAVTTIIKMKSFANLSHTRGCIIA